mmetsp:Transcript_12309/g.31651  ORF Transcript_12309/g.31651 Transcript_12309/m.31651 type:complete len:200 (-) Transcript_12309:80-679(-)
MVVGVVCAALTVVAKLEGKIVLGSGMFLGVCVAALSTFSGAIDLVMKSVMGSDLKLTPVDSMCYMAVPAMLFLMVPGFLWSHPIGGSWAAALGTRSTTDFAVIARVWAERPVVLAYATLSGVLAFGYNVFQTFLAVKLSPSTTAFAGNFNKAAGILISLVVLEGTLAPGIWGKVALGSIAGNILAFTAYNAIRSRRRAA